MQRGNYHTTLAAQHLPQPLLSMAVLYEDLECGRNGKRTCDVLAENLDQLQPVRYQMWRFDVLSVPKLREMALRDACASDVVVISCHGIRPLPDEVRECVDRWLAKPGRGLALVGLIDAPEEDAWRAVQLRRELESAARRAGVEFFCQCPEPRSGVSKPDESPLQSSAMTPSVVAHSYSQVFPPQRWGINE